MREVKYICNVCRQPKKLDDLVGLTFKDPEKFYFDKPNAAESVHICISSCLKIIKEETKRIESGQILKDTVTNAADNKAIVTKAVKIYSEDLD